MYVYVYIYIYMYTSLSLSLSIYIYTHMYIYIYIIAYIICMYICQAQGGVAAAPPPHGVKLRGSGLSLRGGR